MRLCCVDCTCLMLIQAVSEMRTRRVQRHLQGAVARSNFLITHSFTNHNNINIEGNPYVLSTIAHRKLSITYKSYILLMQRLTPIFSHLYHCFVLYSNVLFEFYVRLHRYALHSSSNLILT